MEKKTTTEWKAKNGIHDLKRKKKACCLRQTSRHTATELILSEFVEID